MDKLLSGLLSTVSSHLKSPLCNALVPLDLRGELIRTEEVSTASKPPNTNLFFNKSSLPQEIGSPIALYTVMTKHCV